MVHIIRHKIVNSQMTVFALLGTGLGLLGLTVALISKLLEYESTVPQYVTLLSVFILVFAFLGFVVLILGCFGAIKSLLMKGSIQEYDIERELSEFSSSLTSGGRSKLHIIRPESPRKVEKKVSQEEKTTQKTVVKEVRQPTVKTAEKQVENTKAVKAVKVDDASITDFTYEDGLQKIIDRYNTEKVMKAFRNWYNTLMMTFPDISKSYLFKIDGDKGIELSEGVEEEAAVQVKMDSTVFVKMMTKKINPIKAYSSGNLEVKGEMKNMLKLRKLMF